MNKNLLTILVSIFLVLLLCLAVHLRHDGRNGSEFKAEIKIGLIAPLTGTHASGGISMNQGVQVAIDAINAKGGVAGAKLTLVTKDDKNIPSYSKTAAIQLIEQEHVHVLIGPYSSECCAVVKEVVNQKKVPLITPVAMADDLVTKEDYIFRNTLSTTSAQDKINSYFDFKKGEYTLLDGFNAQTIGVLWQKDSWGFELQDRIIHDLKDLNRQDALLFNQSFELGERNFTDFFNKQKNQFPDVIYVISSGEEAISIVSQGRDCGYEGLFYGEGGFNYTQFDEKLKEKADGCLFTSQWHPSFSTPMSDVFIQLYQKTYNTIPDMFAATSYEAVYILQTNIENIKDAFGTKSFRTLLQNELSTPKKLDGLSGTLSFNKNGQCDRPMFLLQKRWDGHQIQSFIVFPLEYSQGSLQWNFDSTNSY